MKCPILSHESLATGYFLLTLEAPIVASAAVPGQFLMIRIAGMQTDPLLRRPISIMDVHPEGTVELLYKIVGRGTRLLSEYPMDAALDIVGPLGNGFHPPPVKHTAVLVGGGIGIPPLIFLAHHLAQRKAIPVHAFLGARTSADIPLSGRFIEYGASVAVATENGETGFRGMVTEPLIRYLESDRPDNPVIYACGPDPMLRVIKDISERRGIPARLSLEEHMGCGVGACLGCVVETTSGFLRVCKDGPVFDADIIRKWQ